MGGRGGGAPWGWEGLCAVRCDNDVKQRAMRDA